MASMRAVLCTALLLVAAPASAATITLDFIYRGTPWLHVTLTEVGTGTWIAAYVPPLPGEWEFDSLWFENGITYTGRSPVFHAGIFLVLFFDRLAWARFTRPCPPCEDLETLGPPIPPEPCERVLRATPHSHDSPEPGVLALLGVAGCLAIGRRRRSMAWRRHGQTR